MQCGKPIIAVKTGGLKRQVVDHRDETENGIALNVSHQSLVGSQQVPYIYEDYASVDDIVDAIMKMYDMGPEAREKLGKKSREYVMSEFSHQKTIDLWHESLLGLLEDWKNKKRKSWSIEEVQL
jgi:glycosyltransferase involved in cell wall biosynthesis